MASVAGFIQLQFMQKSVRVMDWDAREDLESCRSEANYHLSEGSRLLNEKLQDPKEALSNTAIITAALLGISSVSSLLKLSQFLFHPANSVVLRFDYPNSKVVSL